MRTTLFSSAFAAFVLCIFSFPSQSFAKEQTLWHPPVVVTGSAEPDEVANIPARIQIVSQEDIKRTGAVSLPQLLERTTAVRVIQQPGNFSQVQIRGFSSYKSIGSTMSDQVAILIDGNRSGTGNIANIPLGNIERVEIIHGSGALLYGASAVGGVVNIITKRGKGDINGELGAEYGSHSTRNFRAGVNAGLNDDIVGFSIAGQSNNNAQYKAGDNTKYKNTQSHNVGGGATLTFRPEKDSEFSSVFMANKMYDTGSPGDVYFPTPNSSIKNDYAYGALHAYVKNNSDFSLQSSLYANQNVYEDINREWSYDSTFDARTFGTRNIIGIPLPTFSSFDLGRFSLGLEYTRYETHLSGSSISEPESSTDVYSFFGEHKFEVSTLQFQYGLRYDYYDTKTKPIESLNVQTGSQSFDHLTFSGGVNWWLTDWFRLRGSVSTAYVPPTSRQLTGKYSSWGTTYIGNPDLDAEQSLTYDFGLGFEHKDFTLNFGFFHTTYKDRITTEDTFIGWDTESHFINQGKQKMSGFEGDLRYNYTTPINDQEFSFTPYASWQFFNKRKNYGEGLTNKTIPNVPKFNVLAGVGLGYSIFDLDMNMQILGKQDSYDFSTYEYKEFPSVTLLNSRLSVAATEDLSLYFDVRNITDKYYGYKPEFPQPGRTFTAGFTYTF